MVFDLHRKVLRQSVKGGKTKHLTNFKMPTNLNFLPILDKIKIHIKINIGSGRRHMIFWNWNETSRIRDIQLDY